MSAIERLLDFLGPWNWWVLGVVLAAVEIVAPGTFFIWFSIAAILTGTLALLVDLPWQGEMAVFLVLAVAAAFAGRRIYGRIAANKPDGQVNDRLGRQVGRSAVLETALANGSGHIRLDDTLWRVEGPDLPAGTTVRIAGHRDGRLQVVPL